MFPLQALLAHAELTKTRSTTETAEARRAPRHQRCGNLTLYPVVVRVEPIFATEVPAEIKVVASISNVSCTGLGLIAAEALPEGLEFDVNWDQCDEPRPLRFEVVHSRPAVAGMYRVGARLIAGELPAETMPAVFIPITTSSDIEMSGAIEEDAMCEDGPDLPIFVEDSWPAEPIPIRGGVMQFSPEPRAISGVINAPVPQGTFRASSATGFDKTEKLDGQTTCGWERAVEMRRDGDRMWVYIHSPGKKNGWGLYVDADKFESAVDRLQSGARSPFVTSMAA